MLYKTEGQAVSLCIDGWSNICNDPIVAESIQHENKVYIVGTTDTSGSSHTSEYLAEVTLHHIKKAEEKYAVSVIAVVTDNAASMNKMSRLVAYEKDVFGYGCGAHQMNLLAKDLVSTSLVTKVTKVAKLFRNCHLPKAWLEEEGALKPPMPSNVRWNKVVHLFEWYKNSWTKLKSIIEKNVTYFSTSQGKSVGQLIKNSVLFQNVEDGLKCLKPVSVALNVLQSDNVTAGKVSKHTNELPDALADLSQNVEASTYHSGLGKSFIDNGFCPFGLAKPPRLRKSWETCFLSPCTKI